MDASLEQTGTAQGIVELVTVLVAVTDFKARVLTVDNGTMLPQGPLSPVHRSLQSGVRLWVAQQTAQPMGYVEQLYTFVDTRRQNDQGLPVLYVSYLGLVSEANETELSPDARWFDWYDYFPWEDRRDGRRDWIARVILPRLDAWVEQAGTAAMRGERRNRVDLLWGLPPCEWSEERTLQRYELLYEAGLVPESLHPQVDFDMALTGRAMQHDHRRVLATAVSRLRAKIKYRPVIFDLMPERFSLLQLQKSVEALVGCELHKQNFRRQVLHQGLLKPIDQSTATSRGRPARLYRFHESVLSESLISGGRLSFLKG